MKGRSDLDTDWKDLAHSRLRETVQVIFEAIDDSLVGDNPACAREGSQFKVMHKFWSFKY